MEFLLKGLLIGFAIAAPVGPIGVLCIRRTLAEGRASGLVTGLGAAVADACYGAVAGFGLTAISSFLLSYRSLLQLAGGLFLCVLGIKTFLHKPEAAAVRVEGRGLAQSFLSSLALTLANPATILSFTAVFAGAGLVQSGPSATQAALLVLGVFLGSAAWWLILSGVVAHWRRRYPAAAALSNGAYGGAVLSGFSLGVSAKQLRAVNRVSGTVLLFFGLWAVFAVMRF